MEVKANELRIGNLVYKCYPDGKETTEVWKVSKQFINNFGVSAIEPITLTEEWLVKLGFDKISGYEYRKGEFVAEYSILNYNFLWNNFVITIDLNHVHQLQNIYFALTNEELILKNS